MKKIGLDRLVFPIALLLSPCAWAADHNDVVANDFNISTAYRMAVVADCTYHIVPADWNTGSPLKCLQKHSDITDFSNLSDKDIVSWAEPSGKGIFGQPGINAYLLVRTQKELILAIRGTQPPIPNNAASDISMVRDWANNFDALPSTEGFHKGFLDSWNRIADNLKANADAKALLDNLGQRKFMITGHSKGGAAAIIAAIKMKEGKDWPLPQAEEIYAFEAARPATTETAGSYGEGKLPFLKRLDYKADIVPLVPPGAWLNSNRDKYPALAKLLKVTDTVTYDSRGLGKHYYVNGQNELKTDPESLPFKLEGTILEQQIQSAENAYGDWKANLVQSIIKSHELPFCHVLENNHVAYVDYLGLYATKRQQPASGESIHSDWDKFCGIGFLAKASMQDLIANVKKACELYSPVKLCGL